MLLPPRVCMMGSLACHTEQIRCHLLHEGSLTSGPKIVSHCPLQRSHPHLLYYPTALAYSAFSLLRVLSVSSLWREPHGGRSLVLTLVSLLYVSPALEMVLVDIRNVWSICGRKDEREGGGKKTHRNSQLKVNKYS